MMRTYHGLDVGARLNKLIVKPGMNLNLMRRLANCDLKSDGSYSITWHPFESYTDYAGSYKLNKAEDRITFDHTDTPGFDGNGFFLIREIGDLELIDIWFGTF